MRIVEGSNQLSTIRDAVTAQSNCPGAVSTKPGQVHSEISRGSSRYPLLVSFAPVVPPTGPHFVAPSKTDKKNIPPPPA